MPLDEFSLARITRAVNVLDDDGKRRELPAGTTCVIADVLRGGAAYIVEFQLEPPVYDQAGEMLEYPLEEIATLEAEDLAPA